MEIVNGLRKRLCLRLRINLFDSNIHISKQDVPILFRWWEYVNYCSVIFMASLKPLE